jgi:hypothetical protein
MPRKQDPPPRRAQSRTRSLRPRPWWQSPTVITSASVGVIAVVLIVIVIINQLGGSNPTVLTPLSPTVSSVLLHPSPTVIAAVGSGRQPGQLVRLPGDAVLKGADGKPLIVYVGGEYCPFCAAERWSIVYALSRFGTFTGLSQIQSSSTDVYPNTSTVTFYKSTYTSPTIDFSPTEAYDRAQKPLQTLTAQIENIFTTWDRPPYTVLQQQFPFLDIGGLYVLHDTSYNPAILANLTWDQIATKLKDPNDPVTKAIVGNANILTAAICIATGDQPASVCATPTIQAIEPALKAMTPPSG